MSVGRTYTVCNRCRSLEVDSEKHTSEECYMILKRKSLRDKGLVRTFTKPTYVDIKLLVPLRNLGVKIQVHATFMVAGNYQNEIWVSTVDRPVWEACRAHGDVLPRFSVLRGLKGKARETAVAFLLEDEDERTDRYGHTV